MTASEIKKYLQETVKVALAYQKAKPVKRGRKRVQRVAVRTLDDLMFMELIGDREIHEIKIMTPIQDPLVLKRNAAIVSLLAGKFGIPPLDADWADSLSRQSGTFAKGARANYYDLEGIMFASVTLTRPYARK